MRRQRRVKVVATLGPASSATEMIERLFLAGVDVFRINMSHSSHETARALQNSVRWVAKRHRHPIGILADLQGPKFRVGEFAGGRVFVNDGAIFRFERTEKPGSSEVVYLPHPQIFAAVEPGHMLLLDDGKLRMRVIEKKNNSIAAEVLVGGALSSRKGVSLPDTVLPMGPLTDKDRADLAHILKIGVDWIALSFIQRAEDMHDVRKLVGDRAAILAKIEKPSAINDLDDIIAASDGLMVARGDLGVEMPVERVPGLQKQITRKARAAGKPVVVATQMLESMISSPVPTRAEVSDVATAVFDGADAVMLSAEVRHRPVPARGDPDDGPHRHRGRSRPELRRHHSRDTYYAAADRRRRHRVGRARHRRYGETRCNRLLHGDGLDRAARHARASRPADHGTDAGRGHRTPLVARVGHPVGADGRSGDADRYGEQSLPHRLRRGLRKAQRRHPDHSRRAVRLAGRDQHDPHRLRR